MRKYFAADTKSVLVTDWCDIFIHIVHNVSFRRLIRYRYCNYFRIFIPHFIRCLFRTSHFIRPLDTDVNFNCRFFISHFSHFQFRILAAFDIMQYDTAYGIMYVKKLTGSQLSVPYCTSSNQKINKHKKQKGQL